MDCLISVIIPVYNCEDSLKETLDGVCNQTYKNIEIILIDDGSKDNSGEICDEYAENDNRIIVIHNSNHGAYFSRNCGLNRAKGEYVFFADAGDIVDYKLLETLEQYVDKQVDFIEFSHYVKSSNGEFAFENIYPKNVILDIDFINDTLLPDILNLKEAKDSFALSFLWKKLFKKSIIVKHNLQFNNNVKKWGDREFVIQYLNCCKNVVFEKKPLYYYVVGDSQVHLAAKYYPELLDECIQKLSSRELVFKDRFDFNSSYYINYSFKIFIDRLIEIVEHEDEQNSKSIIADFVNNSFVISIIGRGDIIDKILCDYKELCIKKDIDLIYNKLKNQALKNNSDKVDKFIIFRKIKVFLRRVINKINSK